MKRLARALARLYPLQWRARYGAEFDALLDEAPLTWSDLAGVLTSALGLRMRTWTGAFAWEGASEAMQGDATWTRVIDLKHREIPNGYEVESETEYTGADGSKTRVRQYFRELDFGGSYVTLNHVSRNSEPAQTIIVTGTKGETAGDFRTDRTEMVVLQPDGTVRRTEPQSVPVWVKYEGIRQKLIERCRAGLKAGLSPDEILQQFRRRGDLENPAV